MSVEVSRHSEAWVRALIQHSTDAIALLAPDSRIIYASPSTVRIIGYTAEELVGMHSYVLVHPDDLAGLVKQTACLGNQPGDFITFEYRRRHKNGS